MDDKLKKLEADRDKKARQIAELQRKMRQREATISKLTRTADTRRKILAGSWALEEAARDGEFATRMHRSLDRNWLVRDDDRRLFGLAVLTPEQLAVHPNAASIRRGKAKPEGDAIAVLRAAAALPASPELEPEAQEENEF